jgi:hypothetical protein
LPPNVEGGLLGAERKFAVNSFPVLSARSAVSRFKVRPLPENLMDANTLTLIIRGDLVYLTFQPLPTQEQCEALCAFVSHSTRSKVEIQEELKRMAAIWNVSLEFSDTPPSSSMTSATPQQP